MQVVPLHILTNICTHTDTPTHTRSHTHALQVGSPRAFTFPVKDHVALAEALDMVDFESAAEVCVGGCVGGGGVCVWGGGVRLMIS